MNPDLGRGGDEVRGGDAGKGTVSRRLFCSALHNDCFAPAIHLAMLSSRGGCRFRCQQVCVAGEPPTAVGVFAQDGEGVAGAVHRRVAVRRRDGHADMVAEVGPVA